ncbi:unnamed protein product, partial [Iphiclides podalirius]
MTNKVKECRRALQKERDKEYLEALVTIEEQLRCQHEVKIKERIGDELRRWISEYYERTNRLPEFPTEEGGGSRAMFSRQGTGADSDLSKSSPVSSKESKKSKESKDKKSIKTEDNKSKDEMDDLQNYRCSNSAFLQDIINANEEFEDMWKFKDDYDDNQERYYKDIVEREKMVKIEQEIRNVVDEMMRNELELLQAAFDKDRSHKGKKAKKPQKKVRRGGKKSKKKKEKDLTPDRTTESLFEELVANGIIRPYPLRKIDDYIGEKSFVGCEWRSQGRDPAPCLGTLLSALDDVLTTKRRLQLRVRALTAHEIAVQLSFREPVYAEHDAAAEMWWFKTPLERRRQKVLQRIEELQQENEERAATGK